MNENTQIKWTPVKGELMTRWAKDITPESALSEYPRPQLKRKEWICLNGLWDYAILPRREKKVINFDGKILVPFPLESALSGVRKKLKANQRLWYQRTFEIPDSWNDKRILLHFGAIDWEAIVSVNGVEIGTHKGGFVPFSFDISKSLKMSGNNQLSVAVWDPTDKGSQERGKQTLKPFGIKYTAISGIWQMIWLEPVPRTYIESLKMVSNIDEEVLNLKVVVIDSQPDDELIITVLGDNKEISSVTKKIEIEYNVKIPSTKLWSPGNPFLYDLNVKIQRNGVLIDEVSSYFGMRKISLQRDEKGCQRISLNNEFIFQYGPLDQGYWPDGLCTAPTDEALRYDIEIAKKLGFNMIRKHGKVEPERWYYYCDKLGVLVWQDMPSGGKISLLSMLLGFLKKNKKFDRKRSQIEKRNFYRELESMILALFNHPSIIMWTAFNEGWGQFDTVKVVQKIRDLDISRLVNNASGWHDHGVGDISDCHKYLGPAFPDNIGDRAAVCGEFGGIGLTVENHMWQKKFKFAYKKVQNSQALIEEYTKLIAKLKELIPTGLCAAVYTQITDVEGEINGLLTYDREIVKMDINFIKNINQSVF